MQWTDCRCITEDCRSTRKDWQCDIKVHTGSPFGACSCTYCGATNTCRFILLIIAALTNNDFWCHVEPRVNLKHVLLQRSTHAQLDCVRTCARACVRTSRSKILFIPYLVVGLSPSAEIHGTYTLFLIFACPYSVCGYLSWVASAQHATVSKRRPAQSHRLCCGSVHATYLLLVSRVFTILHPDMHFVCFMCMFLCSHFHPEYHILALLVF